MTVNNARAAMSFFMIHSFFPADDPHCCLSTTHI
jgi:hypothetical protein